MLIMTNVICGNNEYDGGKLFRICDAIKNRFDIDDDELWDESEMPPDHMLLSDQLKKCGVNVVADYLKTDKEPAEKIIALAKVYKLLGKDDTASQGKVSEIIISAGRQYKEDSQAMFYLIPFLCEAGKTIELKEFLPAYIQSGEKDALGSIRDLILELDYKSAMEFYSLVLELTCSLPLEIYNDALYTAWKAGDFERGSRWADQVQPFVSKNSYICHNATCLYVATGQYNKALEQVELAKKYDYPEIDKIKKDEDLKPIHDHPRFQAVFSNTQEN